MMDSSKALIDQDEDTAHRYLVFYLGGDSFAVPLLEVAEVIEPMPPQALPNTVPHFLGLINVRGRLFSVVDFRVKFGMKPPVSSERSAYLLYMRDSCNFALAVDFVHAVQPIAADAIETRTHILSQNSQKFVCGVAKLGSQLVSVISLKDLLEDEILLSYRQSVLGG